MIGTVSPPDILTNPEWANFVFVSTIRHPITRIISSLHNDMPYHNQLQGCYKEKTKTGERKLSNCAKYAISNTDFILQRCEKGIYYCYSNYFVRMFAGHPSSSVGHKQPQVTRETLETAKQNFLRYSCVVLQEQWDETSLCLSQKLGLHLSSSESYNVKGAMHAKASLHSSGGSDSNPDIGSSSNSTDDTDGLSFTEVTDEEYQLLESLNELDLEFYEWAKKQILSGTFLQSRLLSDS